MRKPWIANRRVAMTVGIVGFFISVLLIYDAYDRRGGRSPWLIRILAPL